MKYLLTLILFGGAIFIILFFVIVYPRQVIREEGHTVASSTLLTYQPEWNIRQSVNSCGPYSITNLMHITGKPYLSADSISQETPWRYHGYTAPFGLARVLLNHGYSIEERIVDIPDEERIIWLKKRLTERKPVVMLGKKTAFQHYVTLVGYTNDSFHVYDPLEEKGERDLTIDKNGDKPGNIDWSKEQLLTFWHDGGFYGLYRYYALTIR